MGTKLPAPLCAGARWWRYGLAGVLTLLCAGLQWVVGDFLGQEAPMLLFVVAVFGAAYFGGIGPGILATFLSLAAAAYFAAQPAFSVRMVHTEDLVPLMLFAVIGLGISVLSGRFYRTLLVTRKALNELAESENRFRSTFENSAVGITHIDRQGRWRRYNRRMAEIMGCEYEELRNTYFLDWTYPNDRPADETQFEKMMRGEIERYSLEKRYVHKDGKIVWTEVTRSLVRDERGEPDYAISIIQDISERAAARESERTLTRRLADVLRGMGDSFILLDQDLNIELANSVAQQFLGREEALLAGRSMGEIFPSEPFTKQCEYGIRNCVARHFEGYFPRLEAWVEVHAYPVSEGLGVYFRDISHRKRAERAMRESEARFRHLADAMPHAVWVASANGTLEYYNARFSEMVKLEPGDRASDAWERILHPDDAKRFHDIWRNAMEQQCPFHGEFRFRDTEGEGHRWNLVHGNPARTDGGNVTRWYGSSTDIHDVKAIQEQFAWYNAVLQILGRNAQQLLLTDEPLPLVESVCREVMEHLGAQVFLNYLVNPDDQKLKLNAWAGLEEDFVQRYENIEPGCAVCGVVAEIRRPVIFEHVQETTYPIPGPVRAVGIRVYACHPLKIGDRLLGTLSFGSRTKDQFTEQELTVMRLVSDHVAGAIEKMRWVKAVQDYTYQVEQARREAEAANDAKDHFIAVLSHELRTPLTPALAAAGLLKEDERLSDDVRNEVEVIRRNIEIEKRLIDDLLDLTRIVRGKLEVELANTDVAAVLRQAVDICAPDIAAKSLRLKCEVKGRYMVWGDGARLQQVFWNLISNAVKFTEPGGAIEVKCEADSNQGVVVSISDTGRGISQNEISRIFDAFEQLDRRVTRQFGGLGLGLAISRAIVHQHGGRLEASSPGLGKGSTFKVIMPMLTGVAAPSHPITEFHGEAAHASPLRILLVEDHPDTVRIVSRLLRKNGHDVTTAGDIATALDLASSRKFDLLISDLGLPDGSGLDLMRKIKKIAGLKGIALSGFGMEEDIRQSEAAGFVEHLTKPVNVNRLREALSRFSVS